MKEIFIFNTRKAAWYGIIFLLGLAIQAQLWGSGDVEEQFILVAKVSALAGFVGTYVYFLIKERDQSKDAHYYYLLFSSVIALLAGLLGGGMTLILHWMGSLS